MTALSKPSGAYSFVPTTLDDQGVVRGATATAPATVGGKHLFPKLTNNSGSILIYYYTSALPNTITWARINAKP